MMGSISTTISWAFTCAPTTALILVMRDRVKAGHSHLSLCYIFIADMSTTGSPTLIYWPTVTYIFEIVPGIGVFTYLH